MHPASMTAFGSVRREREHGARARNMGHGVRNMTTKLTADVRHGEHEEHEGLRQRWRCVKLMMMWPAP